MEAGISIAIILLLLFALGIVVFLVASMWKIFQKAGYEGWECIIPIYNLICLLKIVGKPWWWLFLMFIPIVNWVFLIWMYNMLSKSFGKDEGFTVGLILLGFVFIPILGFGNARYEGPYGDPAAYRAYREKHFGGFDFEQDKMA